MEIELERAARQTFLNVSHQHNSQQNEQHRRQKLQSRERLDSARQAVAERDHSRRHSRRTTPSCKARVGAKVRRNAASVIMKTHTWSVKESWAMVLAASASLIGGAFDTISEARVPNISPAASHAVSTITGCQTRRKFGVHVSPNTSRHHTS